MINYKTILFAAGCVGCAALSAYGAELYNVQPSTSAVNFSVRHMGIALVRGKFERFKGTFVFDGGIMTKFDGVVDMASLNTGILRRDENLKADSFFAVKRFPVMTIKSDRITQAGKTVAINSSITIRDVTKSVEMRGTLKHLAGKDGMVEVILNGRINREDFGLRLNRLFEFVVGDTVNISLRLQVV